MAITAADIAAIKNPNHVVKYKLELLDEFMLVTGSITADATDVTFNIDATSDIRRTSTMTLFVSNDEWVTENFEIGWLNKMVRFSLGVLYQGEYRWYVMGILLLTNDAFTYDATSKELSISLVDMMAYGTAERGGQIGTEVEIPYESVVKDALAATVARWYPVKYTDIEDFPDVIPYDQEFSVGTYPYQILKQVLDLFPWYEQFFGTDGKYHAQQIPMRISEPCMLTHEDIDDLIISERRSFNFSDVKNTTEIWGKTIKADYTAGNCTLSGDTYTLAFLTEMETMELNAKYCFEPAVDSPASPKIHIALSDDDEPDTLPLYDENGGELAAGALKAGRAYVARCMTSGDGKAFFLIGQKQIHVIVREMNEQPTDAVIAADQNRNDCVDIRYVVNPDSPFACDRYNGSASDNIRYNIERGEIRQVLNTGDYAKIYSTELAYQRGEYENYLKCRMNTDVELTTVMIPFIDVNQKIEYTSPTTGEVHQYIVKQVTMDISAWTMTMRLSRFYNYYPFY